MKRVLLVSPHFPPVAAPDMQRVRMSLAHYRAYGWEPVVLAVEPEGIAAPQEPELLATLPADADVHRCRAWSRRWGMGTLGLRALQPLDRAGSRLLRARRFDLVFFSTTQFLTLVLGPRWRRRFGVPYVVDLQDPWRTAAYERPGAPRPPGGWKYQFARLLAWWFEEHCYRGAAGFISVSPRYLEDLGRRYPWFGARPQAAIPFGAATEDFAVAARLPLPPELPAQSPREVRLLYTGAAGPMLPNAANVLFSGLARFRESEPEKARRLRLCFLGTQYAPEGEARPALTPLAERHCVGDLVREIPHRLGHLQSLRCMLAADALFLPGSIDPAYFPSKLHPYCLAGRPILALVLHGSHLDQVLTSLGGALVVRFSPADPSADSDSAVAAALGRLVDDAAAAAIPRNDLLFQQAHAIEALTHRQCDLFGQALAAP